MSKNIELLDNQKHANLRIDINKYNVPQNQVNAALVTVGELSTLSHEYPIFITKSPNTGQFQLTAMLGVASGENLFLNGDNWNATFIPLDIQRKPFHAVIQDDEGRIVIDTSDEQISKSKGERVFDAAGNATPYFESIKQIFSQLMGGSKRTANLLDKAVELNLLEPVSLNFEVKGENKEITDMYAFNKKAISNLSGEALNICHQSGLLEVAHLVMSSAIHLDKLLRWANK